MNETSKGINFDIEHDPRTINEMPFDMIAGILRTLSKGMSPEPEADVQL